MPMASPVVIYTAIKLQVAVVVALSLKASLPLPLTGRQEQDISATAAFETHEEHVQNAGTAFYKISDEVGS